MKGSKEIEQIAAREIPIRGEENKFHNESSQHWNRLPRDITGETEKRICSYHGLVVGQGCGKPRVLQ